MPLDGAPLTREETIASIVDWHRKRCFFMDGRKTANLQLGSFIRERLGWKKSLPKSERDAIRELATELIEWGNKRIAYERKLAEYENRDLLNKKKVRKPAPLRGEAPHPLYAELGPTIIEPAVLARGACDVQEAEAEAAMEALARTLAEWPWFRENVFKDSPLQLAVIFGEAGDISEYKSRRTGKPSHSALWKRMGVAVMGSGDGANDIRQGGLPKSASKQEWIAHGYSRKRRSKVFVIGDVLVKKAGRYQDIYRARKEYEVAKAEAQGLIVVPAAKIPKDKSGKIRKEIAHLYRSHGHIDKRARRYMEKMLLKHLWKASRRAIVLAPEGANRKLPAADATSIPAKAGAAGHRPSARKGQYACARRTKPRKAA